MAARGLSIELLCTVNNLFAIEFDISSTYKWIQKLSIHWASLSEIEYVGLIYIFM